jgi:hypothetical protein
MTNVWMDARKAAGGRYNGGRFRVKVLAMFALRANRTVSVDERAEGVWASIGPAAERSALYAGLVCSPLGQLC